MSYTPPPKFYPIAVLDEGTGKYEITVPWHVWFLNLARTLGTVAATPGHVIEYAGSPLAQRGVLNFTGAGVTVTDTAGETVVNISAGGGASWTEIEVDFGATPVYSASFTITDAAISAASKVQVLPCGKAATGRTADDWAWDGAVFAALPGSGSATCYAHFLPGPVVGLRKIQYSVGA